MKLELFQYQDFKEYNFFLNLFSIKLALSYFKRTNFIVRLIKIDR